MKESAETKNKKKTKTKALTPHSSMVDAIHWHLRNNIIKLLFAGACFPVFCFTRLCNINLQLLIQTTVEPHLLSQKHACNLEIVVCVTRSTRHVVKFAQLKFAYISTATR